MIKRRDTREYNKQFKENNETTAILKTTRFDNIDSGVIISSFVLPCWY